MAKYQVFYDRKKVNNCDAMHFIDALKFDKRDLCWNDIIDEIK